MRKGIGSKGGSKGFTKNQSGSPSRRASSWGGNSRRSGTSRRSQSNGRSWLSSSREGSGSGGGSFGAWGGDRGLGGPGGGFGEGLGQALGEGIVSEFSDHLAEGNGSAAFWRGVAVCAIFVAAVVLVWSLSR